MENCDNDDRRIAAPLLSRRLCAPHTSHTGAARPCATYKSANAGAVRSSRDATNMNFAMRSGSHYGRFFATTPTATSSYRHKAPFVGLLIPTSSFTSAYTHDFIITKLSTDSSSHGPRTNLNPRNFGRLPIKAEVVPPRATPPPHRPPELSHSVHTA
ncbi:hypothetical protein EVAR_47252_1 [Eumeta japonica]|uniref:Uncharacterized protein n=1 Tax=Eumeta variegata TaxID=151549 RepID=A0A4C1XJB8_EUMVA|nr:hypothetical protein EVAR_47252_1 [Eumeta japonica]